ncbi:MAG: DegV family protein [Anaerolineaceae bacterium]|nr:DegV family protein [Anaerolineaceae bacterium]
MIRIIADTLSCISPMEASRMQIPLLPQIIIFGEKSYRDDYEISNQQFLKWLQKSTVLPKTAAPPPNLYHPVFKDAQKKNDTLIVICPSASLSGTFRSATVAAQDFPDTDIRIIDTRLIAAGLGSVVREAKRQLDNGVSADAIVRGVKEMSVHEQLYVLVDTLEYLHKGGRIGGAKALFGSILQLKPILTLEDGVIQPVESQRTKKNALSRIKALVMENKPADQGSYLCIQHGGADNAALELADWFSRQLDLESVTIFNLPPAVLVHAGPRALAISYFKMNSKGWT